MHLLNKPGRNNDNFGIHRNLFILSFACDFSGAIEMGCSFDLAYILDMDGLEKLVFRMEKVGF